MAFALVPVSVALLSIGVVGVLILSEEEPRISALALSVWGKRVEALTKWNMFTVPMLLNFGLICELARTRTLLPSSCTLPAACLRSRRRMHSLSQ